MFLWSSKKEITLITTVFLFFYVTLFNVALPGGETFELKSGVVALTREILTFLLVATFRKMQLPTVERLLPIGISNQLYDFINRIR